VVQSWTTNYGSVPTINATIELASVQQLDFRLDPIDGCAADGCGELMIQIYAPDCNGDSVADYLQLEAGTLPDYNGNNIPDCCDQGVQCTVGNYPVQWRVEDGGNGHWYALRSLSDRSWQSGVAMAQSLGGHLGTITSASEQSWVCAAALSAGAFEGPDGPFLGGYKNDAGALTWITNEPVDYLGWGPGEPNGGLSERYVHLKLYGEQPAWNDCPSPYATNFIVEWSADCNSDGIVDYGQILQGQLADTNTNGIPDICEARLIIRVPADQPTIQAAIDAAPLNTQCIVAVSAGTYAGPIDFKGKSVIVRGAGASQHPLRCPLHGRRAGIRSA
jgi:hypothetical protein